MIRKRFSSRSIGSYSDGEEDVDGGTMDTGTTVTDDVPVVVEIKKEPVTLRKVGIRAATAFTMIGLYLLMLRAGHFYCILVAILTQIELYRELVNIRYVEAKEREMPWFRTLQWGWFIVPMFSVYGETVHKFCREHDQLVQLTAFTTYIGDSIFILYCFLFIASVLTLREKLLRFQLSQYMWSIVTVCFVVFQCKFFAQNALNGLFWYFFPMATVVMNDVSGW